MRIHVRDLTDKLSLTLTGDEAWMSRIYADFPTPPGRGAAVPKITGSVTAILEEAGTVLVEGRLHYAPLIPCAQCDAGVAWPLDLKVRTRYLPEDTGQGPKERTLSRHELDAYYLENDELDLEQLINDMIQTAVPAFVDGTDEDGPKCPACGDEPLTGQTYVDPALSGRDMSDPKASGLKSPFEALKGLKLKQ